MASESDAGKQRKISGTGDVPLPPRLPSEASANVSWQVFGLTGLTYSPDFPGVCPVSSFDFRTCLPLRGSSGFSPDSLFTLVRETEECGDYILCAKGMQAPQVVNIFRLWKARGTAGNPGAMVYQRPRKQRSELPSSVCRSARTRRCSPEEARARRRQQEAAQEAHLACEIAG